MLVGATASPMKYLSKNAEELDEMEEQVKVTKYAYSAMHIYLSRAHMSDIGPTASLRVLVPGFLWCLW